MWFGASKVFATFERRQARHLRVIVDGLEGCGVIPAFDEQTALQAYERALIDRTTIDVNEIREDRVNGVSDAGIETGRRMFARERYESPVRRSTRDSAGTTA